MRSALALIVAAVALSACADEPTYAYCYDPHDGVRGYYTGALDPKPACARRPYQGAYYAGPYSGGWRGPYVAGPFPAPPAAAPASR